MTPLPRLEFRGTMRRKGYEMVLWSCRSRICYGIIVYKRVYSNHWHKPPYTLSQGPLLNGMTSFIDNCIPMQFVTDIYKQRLVGGALWFSASGNSWECPGGGEGLAHNLHSHFKRNYNPLGILQAFWHFPMRSSKTVWGLWYTLSRIPWIGNLAQEKSFVLNAYNDFGFHRVVKIESRNFLKMMQWSMLLHDNLPSKIYRCAIPGALLMPPWQHILPNVVAERGTAVKIPFHCVNPEKKRNQGDISWGLAFQNYHQFVIPTEVYDEVFWVISLHAT
jgi:hypothetical protein